MRRTSMLLALAMVAGLVGLVASPAMAATEHWVNDDDPNGLPYAPPGTSCTNPGYATVQAAVDAATAGDDIRVCNGTYLGNITIDKANISVLGESSTMTVITSGVRGITLGESADGGRLSGLKVEGMIQEGVYTNSSVDDYTIRNFRSMDNGTYGIGIHNDAVISGWDISQAVLSGNSIGMRVRGEAYDLAIRDGSRLNTNGFGLMSISSPGDPAVLDGLTVSDTQFNDNTTRGMYFEALSHALFEDIEVLRTGGTGVDINLKFGDHEGIRFENALFADTSGTGLFVKGRNDGANAGSLDSFLATGITSRDNVGSGVTFGNHVTNAEVTQSNLHDNGGAGLFDYTDAGTGVIDAECNWWGAANGPSGQGPGSGDEVFSVNDGVDYAPWLTGPAPGGACAGNPPPPSKEACKNGGWREHSDDEGRPFKNQGDCVSYSATGGRNKADG